MKQFLSILIVMFCLTSCNQKVKFTETEVNIPSEKITVNGALIEPENGEKVPLVIIIPGSGPSDRNGNVGMVKNNSLKLLAEGLKDHNIATYRYDKSALEWMKIKDFKEENGSFDDFIADAKSVVNYFKNTDKYSKIIIAGYSQGSLVGMITAAENVDGFISIAGAGRTIDRIIIEQISKQAPSLIEETTTAFEILKSGEKTETLNPTLMSLLRPSVQPFMMSWMKYNPQEELKKLTIPILIINGTKDIQVPVFDAELLNASNSTSEIKIINNMNHIFKEITDNSQNITSYTNPDLPIMKELVTSIEEFAKK